MYGRNNAVPNEEITLRVTFTQFGVPFDPDVVGPICITSVNPAAPAYDPNTDLLETIPEGAVTKITVGTYEYTVSNTTIGAIGTYFDAVKFKFDSGGPEFQTILQFEVTATGVPKLGYVTVQEIRDEGLTDEIAYPDALVNKRIKYNTLLIERMLGRWFEARPMIVDVDGPGGFEMQLDFPIVSMDPDNPVTLLDRTTPVSAVYSIDIQDLVIYNRHMQGLTNPDDRDDPRLGNILLPKGRMNIRLNGVFGYTDRYGETPEEIKRALTLMVLRDRELLAAGKRNSLIYGQTGAVKEETTDDHSYELNVATPSEGRHGYFTGDPEIDNLLSYYVRPFKMGKGLGAGTRLNDHGRDIDLNRGSFDFYYGRSL